MINQRVLIPISQSRMDKLQAIANRDNLPVWLIINRMIDDFIYGKADNSLYDELEDLPSRGA
jgi:hypothetical protein